MRRSCFCLQKRLRETQGVHSSNLYLNPLRYLHFLGFPGGSAGQESTCHVGDLDLIPGLGWSPGEWNSYPLQYSGLENTVPYTTPGEGSGNPLQYSCLGSPMGRGAWWAAVHGFAKSWTRLSNFTFTFHFHALEKEMATHSSTLAWRIPGTGEPGGLLSRGSRRVDWSIRRLKQLSSSSSIRPLFGPWDYKESDMTEQLSLSSPFHLLGPHSFHNSALTFTRET